LRDIRQAAAAAITSLAAGPIPVRFRDSAGAFADALMKNSKLG
jgi:hypothetical protein